MKTSGQRKPTAVLFKRSVIALTIGASFGVSGIAQAAKFEEAVGKAVRTHPDVVAKWRSIEAAAAERDISWGRYMPTLDVMYGTADERKNAVGTVGWDHYSTNSGKASLKLNLFEGLATLNDTARLEHATLVRYYELLDLSETAAMEAAKAYIDTYRYRQLVDMAEENYATHRLVFEKVGARTKSGVGRGVDLEMAAARLALAESNLLTEASNQYDVTARYQRIIGENPSGEMTPPNKQLGKDLPKTRGEAVQSGFKDAPVLKAAVQNILSSQRNIEVQKSGYYPRVDAYADKLREKNTDGIDGLENTETVGVMVTWNLFRGWQDDSRVKKAVAETSMAKETRERVCRDLRQNLATAYNDQLRLTEQLAYLDQHQLSSGKSVEAMRRQFDIGQRSLLDVLDTENEYYQARRNYLNGEMDLLVAQAKYQASAGTLLKTLNLKALEFEPPTPETELMEDARNQCPPEPATYQAYDKEAVYARAKAREDLMRGQARDAADKEQATTTSAPATSKPKK